MDRITARRLYMPRWHNLVHFALAPRALGCGQTKSVGDDVASFLSDPKIPFSQSPLT